MCRIFCVHQNMCDCLTGNHFILHKALVFEDDLDDVQSYLSCKHRICSLLHKLLDVYNDQTVWIDPQGRMAERGAGSVVVSTSAWHNGGHSFI